MKILKMVKMNEIFIIGKVIQKVEFSFIYKSKNISKSKMKVRVKQDIIEVIGYDEKADYCYRELKEDTNIFIEGKLNSNMEIEVKEIYII